MVIAVVISLVKGVNPSVIYVTFSVKGVIFVDDGVSVIRRCKESIIVIVAVKENF